MPGKSRRSRERRLAAARARKMSQTTKASSPPSAPSEARKAPVAPSTSRTPSRSAPQIQLPFIGTELKRIAIIGGIVLVILVIVVWLLPK